MESASSFVRRPHFNVLDLASCRDGRNVCLTWIEPCVDPDPELERSTVGEFFPGVFCGVTDLFDEPHVFSNRLYTEDEARALLVSLRDSLEDGLRLCDERLAGASKDEWYLALADRVEREKKIDRTGGEAHV